MLRVSTRLSRPKRSAVTLHFGRETQMASRVARWVKVVCVSLSQLLYVSTTRGTHTQPSSWHLGSLAMCLRCSLAAAAAPVIPASFSMAGVSVEAKVMSSHAAGLPLSQSATKTSAGQVCLRSGVNQLVLLLLLLHYYYYYTSATITKHKSQNNTQTQIIIIIMTGYILIEPSLLIYRCSPIYILSHELKCSI